MNRMRRLVFSVLWAVGLAAAIAVCGSQWDLAADDAGTSSGGASSGAKSSRTRAALHAAVEANLGYCRDWLAAKDFQSLEQTAGGVGILAAVFAQQGDDEKWRAAAEAFSATAQALKKAAGDEKAERCTELLARLAAANKELSELTPKRTATPAKAKPTAELRPLMLLLDGTYTDAKTALAAGDVPGAKNTAVVLSELGRLVSNQRAEATWRSAAGAVIRTASDLADAKETDAKAVRQQLRGVYEKCQACHERSKR